MDKSKLGIPTMLGIVFYLCSSSIGFAGGELDTRSNSDLSHADINDTIKFTSKEYGVSASPRITRSRKVRKGGGRRQLGKPYLIKGKLYTPKVEPDYNRTGQASWYGPNFHGRLTANGEVYDQYALSGAHPTFPLPSYARVINLSNGKSVIVRVNDRGPYHDGRIIDLSARASNLLGYQINGLANVRVQYLGPAPLHGRDKRYLEASFRSESGTRSVSHLTRPSGSKQSKQAKIGLIAHSRSREPSRKLWDNLYTGSLPSASRKTLSLFTTKSK